MSERAVRIAIIGAGPSAFYAAAALIKQDDIQVRVDLFDRLFAPYGLVRYGVAPDHPAHQGRRQPVRENRAWTSACASLAAWTSALT
jgi:cation diffusion facilitator CzcD-associated flavoprotein CzcO